MEGVMSVSAVKGIICAATAIAVAILWYRRAMLVPPEHRIEQMRRADERLKMLKRVAAETDPGAALKLLNDIDKRFGDPSVQRKPNKRFNSVAIARRDALLADLRTVGARDPAATKRLLEKHANAYAREMTTKFFGVALAALLVVALVLFGE